MGCLQHCIVVASEKDKERKKEKRGSKTIHNLERERERDAIRKGEAD